MLLVIYPRIEDAVDEDQRIAGEQFVPLALVISRAVRGMGTGERAIGRRRDLVEDLDIGKLGARFLGKSLRALANGADGRGFRRQRGHPQQTQRSLFGSAESFVDFADLFDPFVALPMLQVHDVIEGPVEVIGDVRYFLVKCFRGVARYPSPADSPSPASSSTSTSFIFL